MILYCIISFVVEWSDGQEIVKREAIKAHVVEQGQYQLLIDLDGKDLQNRRAVLPHITTPMRRWINYEDCYPFR
jgi:hypothetical protein